MRVRGDKEAEAENEKTETERGEIDWQKDRNREIEELEEQMKELEKKRQKGSLWKALYNHPQQPPKIKT